MPATVFDDLRWETCRESFGVLIKKIIDLSPDAVHHFRNAFYWHLKKDEFDDA